MSRTAQASFAGILIAISILAAPARAAEPPVAQVLFVCEHGNVKSLMAATYFNELAAQRHLRLHAVARGTAPDSTTVPTPIAAALDAEGFDVRDFHPTAVSTSDIDTSTTVVTIGTHLPSAASRPQSKIQEWNDVPPASTSYAAASATLKAHVRQLIEQLSPPPAVQ